MTFQLLALLLKEKLSGEGCAIVLFVFVLVVVVAGPGQECAFRGTKKASAAVGFWGPGLPTQLWRPRVVVGSRTAHSDLGLAIRIVVAADGVQESPLLVAVCRM